MDTSNRTKLNVLVIALITLTVSAYIIKPTGNDITGFAYIQPIQTSSTSTTTTTTTIPKVHITRAAVKVETTTSTTTEPLPSWSGDIPEVYGDGTGCSQNEADIVARTMWAKGASDDTVLWMLRVISRESTCDTSAHNGDRSTGDNSWGLCQLNVLAGFFKEGEILQDYDPESFSGDFQYNASACADLWEVCGRGPWNKGDYYCRTPES